VHLVSVLCFEGFCIVFVVFWVALVRHHEQAVGGAERWRLSEVFACDFLVVAAICWLVVHRSDFWRFVCFMDLEIWVGIWGFGGRDPSSRRPCRLRRRCSCSCTTSSGRCWPPGGAPVPPRRLAPGQARHREGQPGQHQHHRR